MASAACLRSPVNEPSPVTRPQMNPTSKSDKPRSTPYLTSVSRRNMFHVPHQSERSFSSFYANVRLRMRAKHGEDNSHREPEGRGRKNNNRRQSRGLLSEAFSAHSFGRC